MAVVTAPPLTCSGAAKAGVNARPASRVSAPSPPAASSSSRSLAMPKSRSFTRRPADQDVRRFQVAVDDELAVRRRDRVDDVEEEPETRLEIE